jgi:hypothetical protein
MNNHEVIKKKKKNENRETDVYHRSYRKCKRMSKRRNNIDCVLLAFES